MQKKQPTYQTPAGEPRRRLGLGGPGYERKRTGQHSGDTETEGKPQIRKRLVIDWLEKAKKAKRGTSGDAKEVAKRGARRPLVRHRGPAHEGRHRKAEPPVQNIQTHGVAKKGV